MTNRQFNNSAPEWMPEYVAGVTAFAEKPDAAAHDMSTIGADALWYAASYREPELLEPAETLLTRATADVAEYRRDRISYLGARLAHAFVEVHQDWANGEDLRSESVAASHLRLVDFMAFAGGPAQSSNTQERYEAREHLTRAVYMSQCTRTGDPSPLVFPAPPAIQFDASGKHAPHNAFVAIDGVLRACNIVVDLQRNPPQVPGVIDIPPGAALIVGVQREFPDIYKTFANLATSKRRAEAVLHVARFMIAEAAGEADERTLNFLRASSMMNSEFLRRKVIKVPPARE